MFAAEPPIAPTIPAAQVNSDWDALSGVAQILNKPALSTVATSGSYDDLTDKPIVDTTYSIGESVVGTWIDGRTIYRQVVPYMDIMPGLSGWIGVLGVTGVDMVVGIRTIVNEGSAGRTYGQRDGYFCEADPENNIIRVYNSTQYNIYVAWFIIDYVKTA